MTLVSCLMPVGPGRERLAPIALQCFLAQTYFDRELIIFDDHGSLGPVPTSDRILVVRSSRRLDPIQKLSAMAELAQGELLARWDDDDWSHPRRLELQVQALKIARTRACYIRRVPYVDLRSGKRLLHQIHCLDGTMVFEKQPFLSAPSPRSIWRMAFPDERPAVVEERLYLGTLHGWNISEDQPRLFDPDPDPIPLPPELAALVGSGYCIKTGYQHRLDPLPWHGEPSDGRVWQPDVYERAAQLARDHRITQIVDAGCGSANKLSPLASAFEVIGFDQQRIVDAAHARHPHLLQGKHLHAMDLERANFDFLAGEWVGVAADVIEHLREPERLLRQMTKASIALVSTPDRILTHGHDHDGPPPNPEHVREWSDVEFQQLILGYFDKTHRCRFEHTRSNDRDGDCYTLLAICLTR